MTSPIIDWWIKLNAEEMWDLDLLTEHFGLDDCAVTREDDGAWYLKSIQFRGIQDTKEVIAAARSVMAAMNGAAKVIAPWFQPVNSDNLISVHENGSRGTVILAGPLSFRVRQEIPPRELGANNSAEAGKAELWVQLAKSDDAVAKALRVFGVRPPTWSNLYNIYELIREDVGGWKTLVLHGWAEESELSRFRATANDPAVIGDDARHALLNGQTKWSESFQPMPHDEAKALTHRLLQTWLNSKVKTQI